MGTRKSNVLTETSLRLLMATPMPRPLWEAITGDDFHLRLGNAPAITRRADALDALEAFLARLTGVGRDYWAAWRFDEAIFVESELAYRAGPRREASIPCTMVARVADAELLDLRLHLDPSPIP
ncbi:MAG: hypothetical protein K2X76_09140 [Sphingomonas sp.]|nr:hypothetical protein [Sphingomonas sp.]